MTGHTHWIIISSIETILTDVLSMEKIAFFASFCIYIYYSRIRDQVFLEKYPCILESIFIPWLSFVLIIAITIIFLVFQD